MGAPNYVNPPSIGWKVETADLVTIIAALIFVITRMYTKICLTRCTGWEDCKTDPSACSMPVPNQSVRYFDNGTISCNC